MLAGAGLEWEPKATQAELFPPSFSERLRLLELDFQTPALLFNVNYER